MPDGKRVTTQMLATELRTHVEECGEKAERAAKKSEHVEHALRNLEKTQSRLAATISELGDLPRKFIELSKVLGATQENVNKMTQDRVRAEGFAAGLAEAKKPNRWVEIMAPVIVASLLALMVGWVSHTLWEGPTHQASTTTTVEQTHRGN